MRALIAVLVATVLAAGCRGDDGGSMETVATGTDECARVEAPAPREPEAREAPSELLDPSKTYALTFETSCGSFTVTLDQKLAPHTTASLVALARDGYFDDTLFHRVVPSFVIQGGDPTQSGGGGPGYSTVDRPPADAKYTKGVVAMAKSRVEAPGTAGSQFFIVTDDGAADVLTPDYAIVGKVTEGIDAVERIEKLGVDDGPPSQPVVVSSVTVGES